jgi:hypothetical protein
MKTSMKKLAVRDGIDELVVTPSIYLYEGWSESKFTRSQSYNDRTYTYYGYVKGIYKSVLVILYVTSLAVYVCKSVEHGYSIGTVIQEQSPCCILSFEYKKCVSGRNSLPAYISS